MLIRYLWAPRNSSFLPGQVDSRFRWFLDDYRWRYSHSDWTRFTRHHNPVHRCNSYFCSNHFAPRWGIQGRERQCCHLSRTKPKTNRQTTIKYIIMEKSEKGFVPTLLLCFFLGGLGVHRFYAGKVGTGILMLLTLGGLGIWAIIDFVMIACGSFKDGQGLPIKN